MFMPATRAKYDLESLWLLGEEFDPQCARENDPYTFTADDLPWLRELEAQQGGNLVTEVSGAPSGEKLKFKAKPHSRGTEPKRSRKSNKSHNSDEQFNETRGPRKGKTSQSGDELFNDTRGPRKGKTSHSGVELFNDTRGPRKDKRSQTLESKASLEVLERVGETLGTRRGRSIPSNEDK